VPPSGVTTANVCRLSGKLASDGCQDVDVVNREGVLERRSMVYTEYFARGTVPTMVCDLHPSRGLMTKLAGMFGGGEKPPAPSIAQTGIPPTPAATAGTVPSPPPAVAGAPPPQPKKKRGFWSRVLGIGKDDDKDDKKKDDKKEDKEEKEDPQKKGGE
jgi:hypothetical protein